MSRKRSTPRRKTKPDATEYMLFESVHGQPVARTIRAQGGVVRSADGIKFFTVAQAVKRFKLTRPQLIELWNDAFGNLPWAKSPPTTPDAPRLDDKPAPLGIQHEADWYRPELVEWSMLGADARPNAYNLYEDGHAEPPVATITINPAIDKESAWRIACLICAAPNLWRGLRTAAPWLMIDGEGFEEFAAMVRVLWDASSRHPYAEPKPDEDEERIMAKRMAWEWQQIPARPPRRATKAV